MTPGVFTIVEIYKMAIIVKSKLVLKFWLIDCWLLGVQRQIYQQYIKSIEKMRGREQLVQLKLWVNVVPWGPSLYDYSGLLRVHF